MSVYEYEDMTIFEAAVDGHLLNGPPITVTPPGWWPLRDQVYDAARAVVPFPAVADFHLVYRNAIDGELHRTRWTLEGELLGPTLLWHEDTSGDSSIMFQLIRRNDRQQRRDDLNQPNPWGGLQDVIPAALGKQALGAEPVTIPLPGSDDMVFTPHQVRYGHGPGSPVNQPYGDHMYGWAFIAEPTDPHEPAIWLVPAGQSTGLKLSMCTDSGGNTWSDPAEPCPTFEILPPLPPSGG